MLWQRKTKIIKIHHTSRPHGEYQKTQPWYKERSDKSRHKLAGTFASLNSIAGTKGSLVFPLIIGGILLIFLCGCNAPVKSKLPTPMPTEYLPTAVALTMEAGKTLFPPLKIDDPTHTPQPTQEMSSPTETATPQSENTASPIPMTPTNVVASPAAVSYGEVFIPTAEIEIRTPGHLSRVASPIPVYAILKPGYDRRVRVELFGEDQRILVRQIVSIPYINREGEGILSVNLNFEIPGTAEAARLAISTEDEYGRMVALNSIPLILISIGESDIIPALDMRQPIFIQQPTPKTLIQGDTVMVSGRAHPDGDEFIMIQFVGQDGKVVGKRVCSLSEPDASDYGLFMIDVPFTVTESTPVLMIVWQSQDGFSNIIHLTSQEVLLSPK
ncbi:MAG: hypothetical protein JW908_05470 [Anaerolineales bacterium]|nr:hypothetical protein [Anaerolineales bacterium]